MNRKPDTARLPRTRPANGFTMLELLFVAAILAILAAVALPSLATANRGLRLRTAVGAVTSKLADAKTNALKRNRAVWLLLDAGTRTAQVQTLDGGGATVNVGGPEILPRGVTFVLPGGASIRTIIFDSVGRLAAQESFQVAHPAFGAARTVTVTTTGRVTVD